MLSIRGFDSHQSALRASALTFFSLLSIVPVLAMAFGISKGFGVEKLLEEQIVNQFHNHQEIMLRMIEFSRLLLQKTSGGIVAGIGIITLFWAVIQMLGNIEKAFNQIWGVKTGRTLARKFSDYLSLMLICPLLLILAGSIHVFMTTQLQEFMQLGSFLTYIGPVAFAILAALPYVVIWGLLMFLYMFIPNTKVNAQSAMLGALIAGSGYQIIQLVYIRFQGAVTNYGAVYGSFAALPLFLIWLQLSWLIVLYGAELSYAHQNEETYEFEPDALHASSHYKKLVALRVMQITISHFKKREGSIDERSLTEALQIPARIVREELYQLLRAGVLVETGANQNKIKMYQPAWPLEDYTIKNVLNALEKQGEELPIRDSPEIKALRAHLHLLELDLEKSKGNISLSS